MIIDQSNRSQHVLQVITSNSTNIGTTELLKIQMQIMEDISGVHGALQGQMPSSGTSSTLYAQQTQNATTSMVDLLLSFGSFVQASAYKDLKNIQQYYDDKKIQEILGYDSDIASNVDKIRNVEFDISIQESQTTPVYREMANQFLVQLWQAGQISVEQLLEHGTFPYADELLQSIRAEKAAQVESQAAPEGVQSAGSGVASQGSPRGTQSERSALLGADAGNGGVISRIYGEVSAEGF